MPNTPLEWTHVAAMVACVIGGGLGGYAMINPVWASNLVRLAPTPGMVEGKSEFRSSYGGLFLAGHAFPLWSIASNQPGAELAAGTIGAAWTGSGLGRLLSIMLDRTGTKLNAFNVGFELVLGAVLLSPLLLGTT